MAFKSVEKSTSYTKATDIKVGDSFVGYFTGYERSKYSGPDGEPYYNLVFQDEETGDRVVLASAGNLKYSKKDDILKPGLLTKITRKKDGKSKNGQNVSNFERSQDPENSIDVSSVGSPVDLADKELNKVAANINKLSLENDG